MPAWSPDPVRPAADAPPKVAVVRPIVRRVAHSAEFAGEIETAQIELVQARVSGRLVGIHFKPGAVVKQGDLLFKIDPAPFQAKVDKCEEEVRLRWSGRRS